MNKPIFYKSFRSRNFKGLDLENISVADESSREENIILDIGFGTGDSTIFLQQIFPQHKVYGIEAYKPGVKFLRDQKINAEYGDAADIIEKFKNKTISQIYMLFPDPWQKSKHRKRRLFNEYIFSEIHRVLKRNGLFHFTSDNINYALEAKRIISKFSSEVIDFSKKRGLRPITKYEMKGLKKKNFIFDLIYTKR